MTNKYNILESIRTKVRELKAAGNFSIKNYRIRVTAEEYAFLRRKRPQAFPFSRLIVT